MNDHTVGFCPQKSQAQFKHLTFHIPNLLPIWVDLNDICLSLMVDSDVILN